MTRLMIVAMLAGCAPEGFGNGAPMNHPATPESSPLTPGQGSIRDALCATGPTPDHAASLDWLGLPPCA